MIPAKLEPIKLGPVSHIEIAAALRALGPVVPWQAPAPQRRSPTQAVTEVMNQGRLRVPSPSPSLVLEGSTNADGGTYSHGRLNSNSQRKDTHNHEHGYDHDHGEQSIDPSAGTPVSQPPPHHIHGTDGYLLAEKQDSRRNTPSHRPSYLSLNPERGVLNDIPVPQSSPQLRLPTGDIHPNSNEHEEHRSIATPVDHYISHQLSGSESIYPGTEMSLETSDQMSSVGPSGPHITPLPFSTRSRRAAMTPRARASSGGDIDFFSSSDLYSRPSSVGESDNVNENDQDFSEGSSQMAADELYMTDWATSAVAAETTSILDYLSLDPELSPMLPQPLLPSPPTPRSAVFQHKRTVDAVGPSRSRYIDNEKPIHGQNFFTLGKGGLALVLERDDEILVYDNTFMVESELDNPLFLYHSRQYLDPVTLTDPLVNLRLVFLAHQLPRGPEFANLVGPLRARYMIDTYLIPHETICVHEDDDVVFGLSGTLDRVCQGLREFLLITAPRPDEVPLWELCILVPSRVLHLLTCSGDGLEDGSPIYVAKYGPVESSIPCLMEAKTRSYGPISSSRQESIITMESSSVDIIIGAIKYVGQILLESDDPHESCHEYYRGGQPSVIPAEKLDETHDL